MEEDREIFSILVREIRKTAEKEVNRILREAEEKAKRIVEDAVAKAEELKKRKLEEARREVRARLYREFLREIAPIRMKLRAEYIRKKSELVECLVNDALRIVKNHVDSLDEEYSAAIRRFLEEGLLSLSANDVIVYCRERDRELVEKACQELGDMFKKRGRNVQIVVSPEPLDCLGGVVLVSRDRREYFNNTIDARLKELRESLLPRLIFEKAYKASFS